MKKLLKKALKGFTLVELIVVIAIIAILSTVGFVSYTGYIRDSRNSVRESNLAEASNVVTQFIAVQGRAPACGTADVEVCDFAPQEGDVTNGIDPDDWAKMNVRSVPTDPKKRPDDSVIHYVYGTNGSDYDLAASKEMPTGNIAIVKGSKENGKFVTGVDSNPAITEGDVPDDCTVTVNTVVAGSQCVPYNFLNL